MIYFNLFQLKFTLDYISTPNGNINIGVVFPGSNFDRKLV